ncbi:hypothetical protein [Rhizobium rhizosphaerae]|uniref:hypothetical protein n=1 Tax=Xaviernesmea rhizosphaerae TaxID=1672749 RepID=UPI00111A6E89|nr:hypothetical protein [Xaviernesmea rhizosphaerae]
MLKQRRISVFAGFLAAEASALVVLGAAHAAWHTNNSGSFAKHIIEERRKDMAVFFWSIGPASW